MKDDLKKSTPQQTSTSPIYICITFQKIPIQSESNPSRYSRILNMYILRINYHFNLRSSIRKKIYIFKENLHFFEIDWIALIIKGFLGKQKMEKFLPSLCFCRNLQNYFTRRKTASANIVPIPSQSSIEAVPKDESEIYAYWSKILRQEEEAVRKTRPWQKLDFIPANNFKQVISTAKGEFLHKDYKFIRRRYDEKRALMDSDVVLLHYPFGPSTQPEGLDPVHWNETFRKARLFLLGTRHDYIQSTHAVRILLGAVHADFVLLGLGRPQSELLIAANEKDMEVKISRRRERRLVEERLKMEGIEIKGFTLSGWKVSPRIDKMHIIYEYATKFMVQWSEFTAAKDILDHANPECAGFVLGLQPEEKLDRLVDLAEDYLIEEILLELNPNRVPRFGEDVGVKIEAWVKELYNRAYFRSTMGYKLYTLPPGQSSARWKRVRLDDLQDLLKDFGRFADKEFPGYHAAMVARQNRQLVRALHTLMHRAIIEKCCAAEIQKIPPQAQEPVTIIAIASLPHLTGIQEIWDKPEEVYTAGS